MTMLEALANLPPATQYWIQLAGWVVALTGAIGNFACAFRAFHHWRNAEWGPFGRCMVVQVGFIALTVLGITMTWVGPQQI